MSLNDPKLSCEIVRGKLAEADLVNLKSGIEPNVRAHLSACDPCAAYREELLKLSAGLGGISIPAPSELYPQTIQALPTRPAALTVRMIVLLTALAIALSVFAVQYMAQRQQEIETGSGTRTLCGEPISAITPPSTEAYSPTSQQEPEQSISSLSDRCRS